MTKKRCPLFKIYSQFKEFHISNGGQFFLYPVNLKTLEIHKALQRHAQWPSSLQEEERCPLFSPLLNTSSLSEEQRAQQTKKKSEISRSQEFWHILVIPILRKLRHIDYNF